MTDIIKSTEKFLDIPRVPKVSTMTIKDLIQQLINPDLAKENNMTPPQILPLDIKLYTKEKQYKIFSIYYSAETNEVIIDIRG